MRGDKILLFLAIKFWGKLNIAIETGMQIIHLSSVPRSGPHHLAWPSDWHTGGPISFFGRREVNSMSAGFVGGVRILNLVSPEFCEDRFLLTLQNC